MIKQEIENSIKRVIEQEDWGVNFKVEHSDREQHGDYATNVALIISDRTNQEPMQVAEKIVSDIENKHVDKIDIAHPGFVNFYLKDSYFQQQLNKIRKGNYGITDLGNEKRIIVEYGQPNTHKLPHVGHLRSYTLGESLARLLEFTGHKVFRVNYQGDIGLHVAKCLWGYKTKHFQKQENLKDNIKKLQQAYQFGSEKYEEDEKAREQIEELNNRIQREDTHIKDLWEKTRQWSIDYYDKLQQDLGINYDRLYFESEAAQKGKQIVMDHLAKVFKKSQGAIIFPGSDYGLHDRVFLTSDDNPTYEAKDLALPFLKKEDFDYDLSLISTASEQIEYFKVVYKALEQIDEELARKFYHVPFGLISLKGTQLSSRKGNIISIEELLEQVEQSLISLIEDKEGNPDQNTISELVMGSIKYSLLKNTPIKDIVFDIKQSVDLEGDSGPYLQYTNVRALSILKKEVIPAQFDGSLLEEDLELKLLKKLNQFPEVISKAAQDYKPNLVCNYLFNLAQSFNSFYEKIPVLKTEDGVKKSRLILVKAVNRVLEDGLHLLGINTPQQM